jgi:GTP-binding protein
MFVDRVRIWVRAGHGGRGCVSFRREKFVPDGGPDGGDGGKGGDVILQVNEHMNNLVHLRFKPHQFAENGRNGMNAQKTGASGEDCVIEVPPGTCVFRLPVPDELFERAAPEDDRELVADLTQKGQRIVLCAGGRGGRGNQHFKSSVNQAPRRYEDGFEGEKGQYIFELKSIADAGLVGFPNAGKSSLLGALSAAKPKVAPYPFTTLQPVIGVIEYDDYERITLADIPGLVEGAHEGVGLGMEFLRHIERCRVLVFVLDMAGSEGREPEADYAQLRKEINLYQAALSDRPFFIIANKMDLPGAAEKLDRFRRRFDVPVIPVSVEQKQGLDEVRSLLLEKGRAPAS